jgi:uncharacterized RDD family membrane protein YckC
VSQPEQIGLRAGFVSRIAAAAVDVIVVSIIYFAMLFGYAAFRFLLRNTTLSLPRPHVAVTVTLWSLVAIAYLVEMWITTGKTVGSRMMGVRVVTPSGGRMRLVRAVLRAAWCVTLPWLSLLWVLLSRYNYGLHDIIFRTDVIYDWDKR